MKKISMKIDVSDCETWPDGFPDVVELAVTVCLPDNSKMSKNPVVLFAFPGGGYSRGYFDMNLTHLPGCENEQYSQVDHHLEQGVIVVTCDHICVGESTVPERPETLTMPLIAAANAGMARKVIQGLADGSLIKGLQPIVDVFSVGLGQSMGGAIIIATQATHSCFDAIVVLGYGVYGARPVNPGDLAGLSDERGEPVFCNKDQVSEIPGILDLWYYPDVRQVIIDEDTRGGYPIRQSAPAYGSLTLPPCAVGFVVPNYLEAAAAEVVVPVLLVSGEQDVQAEPGREPSAYVNAERVEDIVIPKMGHMHNFASSREVLWEKLVQWALRVSQPVAL